MERRLETWHVGKEIPLALILSIVGQTIGGIWWMATFSATVNTKLDDLSYQVAALNADKYSQRDAARDQALADEKIKNLKQQMDYMEKAKWQRK